MSPVAVDGQLRDGADLAREELADRLLLLAVQEQQLADPLILVPRRVPGVGLRVERSREDAQVREPADERVCRGLEDADEERPVRVRRHGDGRPGPIARLGRRLVRRGGEVADERVEQAPQPDAGRGAAHEHGRQDRFLHALAEARLQLGVGDLLALEVLRQDVVVRLRGGFQELVAAAGHLRLEGGGDRDLDLLAAVRPVGLAMDQVHVPGERLAGADGDLERRDLVAEGGPQGVERGAGIGVLAIAHVEEEAGRGVRRPPDRDTLLETRLDAAARIDDIERAVGGVEPRDDLGQRSRGSRACRRG